MYGLIHKALATAVSRQFGEPVWAAVEQQSGVDVSAQFRMDPYKDEQFAALLEAAVEQAATPREVLLEAAGRAFAATFNEVGTRDLIAEWGDSLPAFLEHFDKKYRRIHDMHPKMAPPSLKTSNLSAVGFDVSYRSGRDGLEPFVNGILLQLAEHFATPVRITRDPAGSAASPSVFHLVYLSPEQAGASS